MAETLPKYCDNTSVGVIIQNSVGELALLKRARVPVGIAPPAGHIDEHGSPEWAAATEVNEELGLYLPLHGLIRTTITERRVENQCRREGGSYHEWTVYTAVADGKLLPSPDETKGAEWYAPEQVQELADSTKAYLSGKIPDAEWQANPGLEPVWLDFLAELEYVR